MIDGIEEFYRRIAQSICSAISDEWSSVRYEAIFFPEMSQYEGEYIRGADGKLRGITDDMSDAERAFRQLRKSFQEAGKPLWGRAVFEVFPDGKFHMHWGYDNCDEQGYTIFNEEIWSQQHDERIKRLSAP